MQALTSDDDDQSFYWLTIDKVHKKIIGTKKIDDAYTFKITGDINTNCEISCDMERETFYWTWKKQDPNTWKKQDSDIFLEKWNNEKDKQHKFQIQTSSGEALIKFTYKPKDRCQPLKISKKTKALFASKDHRTTDTAIRIEFRSLNRAPTDQTFLIYPENNETKFYLSLNHIVNSIRFINPKERNIRRDEFLNILHSTNDISMVNLQICLYSLFILIKKPLEESNQISIDTLISKVRSNQDEFFKALSSSLSHKPITQTTYKKFQKLFLKAIDDNSDDNFDDISTMFFQCLFSEKNSRRKIENLKKLTSQNQNISEHVMETLDGTSTIMNDVLKTYPNNDESGHMAIIRVPEIKDGIRMKQTLCIAKMKSGLYKMEIIQDFGNKTTLDKHIQTAIGDAKVNECPEYLRILKRIQTIDFCENDKCHCNDYKEDKSDLYNLKCAKCGHEHKDFNCYADLER